MHTVPYIPKKKRYDSLSTLYKEMLTSSIKVLSFQGYSIEIKKGRNKFFYGMCDGEITITNKQGENVSITS
ncbi:MAG: hypothetical protein CL599_10160 [Alteromonas sp.]|nr:hypothetical protein [Alteromonas sp.]OUX87228.1 MAG: hypothetical protein CBB95_09550 [Alteromonas sp. TMED35]